MDHSSLRHICSQIALLIVLQLLQLVVHSLHAPAAPILCNPDGCRVHNFLHTWTDRKPCKASRAFYPTSEAQLIDAVSFACKAPSKVKMVSKGSHSLPKLVCPGGEAGIAISTQNYMPSFIRVNRTSARVTVSAGVMLRDFLDAIAEHGLALAHAPYWDGVSVGGMISTGAHGSGMWGKGSAPHDYVVGMRLIVPAPTSQEDDDDDEEEEDGLQRAACYAKVIELNEDDEDLNAARLSLGVLGAISTVTFQLEPMFKRSVKRELRGDERLEDEILAFAEAHEFAALNWYPVVGQALFRMDDRVSVDTPGDGTYKLAILRGVDVDEIERSRTAFEALQESRNMEKLCETHKNAIISRIDSGDGLKNDGKNFIGYPVVGYNHKMQSSGDCDKQLFPIVTARGINFNPTNEHHQHEEETILEQNMLSPTSNKQQSCIWNPNLKKRHFGFETAIAIPTSKLKDAILEIKKIQEVEPQAMCSFPGGIFIRFQAKSKAYLGEPTNSTMIGFTYYRAEEPNTPRLHEDIFEEIEQMLLKKFMGKPHWGKNRDLAFEDLHTQTLALDKFLQVRKRFDPLGLFSSEWTNAILGLGLKAQTIQDHCALDGLCICREDSHCHPLKGYFCRSGRVYTEARVCRYEKQVSST